MANQLASFDPVGSFQRGQSNELAIQRQQQDIDAQPQRNELARLKLGGERQLQSQQGTQFNQQQSLQRAKILNQTARALAGLDPSQRPAAFARIEPKLAEFGIPTGTFDANQITDENLMGVIQSTQGFLETGSVSAADMALTAQREAKTALLEKQTGLLGKDGGAAGLPAEAVTFNDLIKDFTPEQQKTAKLIKAGLKGRAMSNALLSAIESGDISNLAEAKAEIKQAEKFAELTGTSRAKAIDKGFDSLIKIDRGIRNIDDAISALDKGAGVGAVEKLWPSIKAASVELDNIRGRMALDVVGAVTFGALSKGELDLAKDVALPTGLNTKELREFLVDRKAAQTKLRAYYNEQIQFLDQGGTVAGFLREKEREQGPGASAEPTAQGMTDNGDGTFTLPDGRIVRRK